MDKKLKGRFCSHRGDLSAGAENSYDAIRAAVEQNVFYVEFDVMYVKGSFWTGHPPSEPIDELERILPLFEGQSTLPKIDLRLEFCEDFKEPIDTLFSQVRQFNLDCVLVTLGGIKEKETIMDAQLYFASQLRRDDHIKLNIDLKYYRPCGEPIDKGIHDHVASLGELVFAISPEIKWEDLDAMGSFAQQHNIPYVCFWLYGLPDEPNPQVSEATLLKALELEERYDVKVLFDIDQGYVTE